MGRPHGGPALAGSSRERHAMAPACKLVGNFGEKILVRPQNFCGFLWVFWSLEGTENN